MAESSITETGELTKVTSPEIKYELKEGEDTALFRIDGQALLETMEKSGHKSTPIRSIVITDTNPVPGELAHFNSLNRTLVLDQSGLVDQLRSIRQEEHDYIDGVQQ